MASSMGMPAPVMIHDGSQQAQTISQLQPQQGQMQPPQQLPQQQQQNIDQNMANRNEPPTGPTPYEMLFLNLESHSSIMLCTLAKDVIREIINQTSDLFKTVKNLQLPLQTPVPPAQLGASLKQYLDKQERDLVPFENEPNELLDELDAKRNENEQFKRLMMEKEHLQIILEQKRTEMERAMNFAAKMACLANPTTKNS